MNEESCNLTPKREKVWTERTPDEKLEALRESMLELLTRSHGQGQAISEITRILCDHSHAGGGTLVVVPARKSFVDYSKFRVPTPLRLKEASE